MKRILFVCGFSLLVAVAWSMSANAVSAGLPLQAVADGVADLATDADSDVDTDLPPADDGPGADADLTTDADVDGDGPGGDADFTSDIEADSDGPGGDADFTSDIDASEDGEDGDGDDGDAGAAEDGQLPNVGAARLTPLIAAIGALILVAGTAITRRTRRI